MSKENIMQKELTQVNNRIKQLKKELFEANQEKERLVIERQKKTFK